MNRQTYDDADLGGDDETYSMELELPQRVPPNSRQTLAEYRAWPVDPCLPGYGNSGPSGSQHALRDGEALQADQGPAATCPDATESQGASHLQRRQIANDMRYHRAREHDQAQMPRHQESSTPAPAVHRRVAELRGADTRGVQREGVGHVPEQGEGSRKRRRTSEQQLGRERGNGSQEGEDDGPTARPRERISIRIPGTIWNEYERRRD
jgi:hypothetical protein